MIHRLRAIVTHRVGGGAWSKDSGLSMRLVVSDPARSKRSTRIALCDNAYSGDELLGWDILEQESTGARMERVENVLEKRLMGFEPTTFCMAIRPISDPARQRIP